jgi:hypothetical protein
VSSKSMVKATLKVTDRLAAIVLGETDAGACVPGFGTQCACFGGENCVVPPNAGPGNAYYWNCFGDCLHHCNCCCG